jgi:hypothetical protein
MVTYSSNNAWTTKMGFVAGAGWRRVKILQTGIQGWERKMLQIGRALSSNNDGNAIQIGPKSDNGFWSGMPPQQQRQISSWGCNEKSR